MSNNDDLSKSKSINRYEILRTIQQKQSISRVQLAQSLKLGKSTISENVSSLIHLGIVHEIGVLSSQPTGGRKRVSLQINGAFKYIIIAEFGLHFPVFALANINGEILFRKTLKIPYDAPYSVRLRLCKEIINEILRTANISIHLLASIAISSPGAFSVSANKFQLNPEFENWRLDQLTTDLKNNFKVKVIVLNDVNAATVGEFFKGISKTKNHSVFLSVGAGVGIGMILDGKLYQGSSGSAGEIARIKAFDSTLQFRSLVEINDLILHVRKNAPESTWQLAQSTPEELNFAEIIKLWELNESFIRNCIEKIGISLGKILSIVISLLNCEIAVLGGDFLVFQDQLLPVINKIVQEEAFDPIDVVPSALGKDAGLIGLLSFAIDTLLQDVAMERENF